MQSFDSTKLELVCIAAQSENKADTYSTAVVVVTLPSGLENVKTWQAFSKLMDKIRIDTTVEVNTVFSGRSCRF